MEHVEVLRRAADELRRADALARKCGKIDRRKVIGMAADNNLSVILSAIASLSAPQPPAEAQPDREPADWPHQDWKGMDGAIAWHLIDRHASGWQAVGEMMDAWLSANSEQPPSAPVGVEAGWYRYNKPAPRWEDTKFGKWLDPAEYGPPREQHGYSLEVAALAQQPAALDGAMVERACKAAVAQCAPDEVWPDNYEEADDLRAMMKAALTAALAALRDHDQEVGNG